MHAGFSKLLSSSKSLGFLCEILSVSYLCYHVHAREIHYFGSRVVSNLLAGTGDSFAAYQTTFYWSAPYLQMLDSFTNPNLVENSIPHRIGGAGDPPII